MWAIQRRNWLLFEDDLLLSSAKEAVILTDRAFEHPRLRPVLISASPDE
jgi:hypothetical protein